MSGAAGRELDREVVRLALPALLALVAEPLFLLADSAVVGRLGTVPLAALGVAAAALATVASVCVFLAYATTASVARSLGAGDLAGALRRGLDGMWLAAGIGMVAAVAGQPFARAAVRALGGSGATLEGATAYLRIGLLGLPGMLVVLAATGVLRGLQDTRTPLVVGLGAAIANTGLNIVLVHPVGLGLRGSAIGTAVVQVAMATVLSVPVVRAASARGVSWRPHAAGVGAVGRAGVPLLLRTVTLRAAMLLTTWVAARTPGGEPALAGHQIASTAFGLLAMALDALAIAAQALVGRWLGAGREDQARAVTARMLVWGARGGAALGVLTLALSPVLGPVFSSDPQVRHQLAAAMAVVALLQPLAGVVFVLDGVLIGAGDGPYLARAGLVTLAVYAPLALLVHARGGGLVALWLAFGAFLLARAVTLVVRWRQDAWVRTGA
ncbi:MATE family efflux transporter [Motilibacter peucedani]|uniref:MATE family efflux transporter n=1 Tax=Motilibacter peucedani TaxID=598650 RepID=UPI001E4B3422|nr:MATE family efflux transporter [Motilibacter peucedani]